jgi:fucose permease
MTALMALLGIVTVLLSDFLILTLLGVILVGFGFANIFPLIFSLTIDSIPQYQNELSGLMVTMIVGGAFIPTIMGTVADSINITMAFIVPLICLCYVLFLGFLNYNKNKKIA